MINEDDDNNNNDEDNHDHDINQDEDELIALKKISLKEDEVEEGFIKIKKMELELLKQSKEYYKLKNTSNETIKAKEKMLSEKTYYESIKKEKYRKLKYIMNLDQHKDPGLLDFNIDKNELLKCIPPTPLDGLHSITESLEDLEKTLKNDMQSSAMNNRDWAHSQEKNLSIQISYLGEKVNFFYPMKHDYTFHDLLKETVDLFIMTEENHNSYNSFVFQNEISSLISMKSPVIEAFKTNPNLSIILVNKKTMKQMDSSNNDNLYMPSFDLQKKKINEKLDYFLIENEAKAKKYDSNNKHKKDNTIDDNTIRDLFHLKKENRGTPKTLTKNEQFITIEKTIGSNCIGMFFYLLFIAFCMYFIIEKYGNELSLSIFQNVKKELLKESYVINLSLNDFWSQVNKDHQKEYKVDINLSEINQLELIGDWIVNVLMKKLSFIEQGRFEYIGKHKIIGPIRFLQKRHQNSEKIDFLTSRPRNINTINTYVNIAKNEEKLSIFPLMNDLKNGNTIIPSTQSPIKEDFDHYTLCSSSTLLSPIDKNLCVWYTEGMNWRETRHSYQYQGNIATYKINGGFFFDLHQEQYTITQLNQLSRMISRYWLDNKTSVLSISFNTYQAIDSRINIIGITIYIEKCISSDIILKSIDVNVYKPYINWSQFRLDITNENIFYALWESFKSYPHEYLYLLFLFIFALSSLINLIRKMRREKSIVIYNQLFTWIFSLIVDCWLFIVLIIKIICIIIEDNILKHYQSINFTEFICLGYFAGGLFGFIVYAEYFMVVLIFFNFLSWIYYDVFMRIYVILRRSLYNFLSFLIIFIMFVFGYSLAFNLLYGVFNENFSTIGMSFTSMIQLIYLDKRIIQDVLRYYEVFGDVLMILYLAVVYFFLLNLIFVIMHVVYIDIIKYNSLTLMPYQMIFDGISTACINLLLKIATVFHCDTQLTIWFKKPKKTKDSFIPNSHQIN